MQIRQRLRIWRIDRSVEKLKIKRDMQERRERRKAKWKSAVKRVSTHDMKQLMEAARETQRIEEAQAALASEQGLSGSQSTALLNHGVTVDPALPSPRRTQNWVHGMTGGKDEDQTMEITAQAGTPSVQGGSAPAKSHLKSMKPAAAAAWFGSPLHEDDLGGASLSLVGKFMRPLWKRKIKAELEAEEAKKENPDTSEHGLASLR